MSRISELFKKIEPVDSESIIDNFEKLFDKYCFDGISVDRVFVDLDGAITVDFVDIDDNCMRVVFAVEDNNPYALIATNEETVLVFDLGAMRPVLRKTQLSTYLDLTDSTWITKSLLAALFTAGSSEGPATVTDANRPDELSPYKSPTNESVRVIRGGKSVRMPVVHEKSRMELTELQKENLVKSLMKDSERELSSSLRLTKE